MIIDFGGPKLGSYGLIHNQTPCISRVDKTDYSTNWDVQPNSRQLLIENRIIIHKIISSPQREKSNKSSNTLGDGSVVVLG